MTDEVGFDGVTVREAIASRTLEALDQVVEVYKAKQMTFAVAHRMVDILLGATLPFCDAGTKVLLHQVQAQWDREGQLVREANQDLEMAAVDMPKDFGEWQTKP